MHTHIDAIMLRREGRKVIVEACIYGFWFPIITEDINANFSHIVEARGINTAHTRAIEDKALVPQERTKE